jgi:hypothetical protein
MWAFFGFGRPHIHIFWVFNGKIIDIADRLVQKGKKGMQTVNPSACDS